MQTTDAVVKLKVWPQAPTQYRCLRSTAWATASGVREVLDRGSVR